MKRCMVISVGTSEDRRHACPPKRWQADCPYLYTCRPDFEIQGVLNRKASRFLFFSSSGHRFGDGVGNPRGTATKITSVSDSLSSALCDAAPLTGWFHCDCGMPRGPAGVPHGAPRTFPDNCMAVRMANLHGICGSTRYSGSDKHLVQHHSLSGICLQNTCSALSRADAQKALYTIISTGVLN
jgi:hypothetical protein